MWSTASDVNAYRTSGGREGARFIGRRVWAVCVGPQIAKYTYLTNLDDRYMHFVR